MASALDVYKVLSERIIHQATAVKIIAQIINGIFKENLKDYNIIRILVTVKTPW